MICFPCRQIHLALTPYRSEHFMREEFDSNTLLTKDNFLLNCPFALEITIFFHIVLISKYFQTEIQNKKYSLKFILNNDKKVKPN